jgi:hypothetical protein
LNLPPLLVVSTLFGGMMLYAFGFAPMVFSALPFEVQAVLSALRFNGTICL